MLPLPSLSNACCQAISTLGNACCPLGNSSYRSAAPGIVPAEPIKAATLAANPLRRLKATLAASFQSMQHLLPVTRLLPPLPNLGNACCQAIVGPVATHAASQGLAIPSKHPWQHLLPLGSASYLSVVTKSVPAAPLQSCQSTKQAQGYTCSLLPTWATLAAYFTARSMKSWHGLAMVQFAHHARLRDDSYACSRYTCVRPRTCPIGTSLHPFHPPAAPPTLSLQTPPNSC